MRENPHQILTRPQTGGALPSSVISPNKAPNKRSISPLKSLEKEDETPGKAAASNAIYKEAASKVVDLQRQVISLRTKLKHKETVESENAKL